MCNQISRFKAAVVLAVMLTASLSILTGAMATDFPTQVFRAAAVGTAVSAAAPALNKFINTVTFQNGLPRGVGTKVVPILSVGEKGYIGAAQVAGPSASVAGVKVVWAYDDSFSQNEFRLRILVPSGSLNPLQLKRVQSVGVTAVIDYAFAGQYKGETFSRGIGAGEVIRAAAVAAAVYAAAAPLNKAINVVTRGTEANTRVVPIISVGEKAYVGGVQVTGTAGSVRNARAAFQYEAAFDTGRCRVKAFVVSNSINPLKFGRLTGLGISAIIDTSIADQERVRERTNVWRTTRGSYRPMDQVLVTTFRPEAERYRHDQGLHKGWYIGKGNQRKMLTGDWVTRYKALSPVDQQAFVGWWDVHYKDQPSIRESRWQQWRSDRQKPKVYEYKAEPGRGHDYKDNGKPDRGNDSEGNGNGKGRGKGRK